jgi:protein-L-isoaspartate(D-aspartate) O-methyltransferase
VYDAQVRSWFGCFTLVAGVLALSTRAAAQDSAERTPERRQMVERQLERRGITDPRVLAAMRKVPRHQFVPSEQRASAYEDRPLPIGHGQTISQPYIVAAMTELLAPKPSHRVLEIGTGSGYQAAVLAELCREVYSIEIVEPLAKRAKLDLERLGYKNVKVIAGDGYRGLPKHAPFDGIIVTAAPERIPEPLLEQLAIGARMVLPVGGKEQELRVIERTRTGYEERRVFGVRFVPMTGEVQKQP